MRDVVPILGISFSVSVASARSSDFASASRLDDFATASRLSGTTHVASATALLAEQFLQQAEVALFRSAAAVASRDFASASRCNDFAATGRFGCTARSSNFATASRLDVTATRIASASAMLSEQLGEQTATLFAAAVATARIDDFATAHRLGCTSTRNGHFTSACRFASDFTAASGFSCTAGVTTAFTKFVQQAKRACV